jgi:hypothetical protein
MTTPEKNLASLLQRMQPTLNDQAFVFCSIAESELAKIAVQPLMIFREEEAVTLVLTEREAASANIAIVDRWALITCRIHSDLNAVGFLAAMCTALAAREIPCNAVSAFIHDHLFVPWESRDAAIKCLQEIAS